MKKVFHESEEGIDESLRKQQEKVSELIKHDVVLLRVAVTEVLNVSVKKVTENCMRAAIDLVNNVVHRSVRLIIEVIVSKNLIWDLLNFCKSKPVGTIKHEVDLTVFVVGYMLVRIFVRPVKVIAAQGNLLNILGMVFKLCSVAFDLHLFLAEKENSVDHFSGSKAVEGGDLLNFIKKHEAEKNFDDDGSGADFSKKDRGVQGGAFTAVLKIDVAI